MNNDSNHTSLGENNINHKLNKLTRAVKAIANAQIEQMVNISNNLKKPVLSTSKQVPAIHTTTTPNIAPSIRTFSIAHNNHFYKQQVTSTSQFKRTKLNYSDTYKPTFHPENQLNPYDYHKKRYNHNSNLILALFATLRLFALYSSDVVHRDWWCDF